MILRELFNYALYKFVKNTYNNYLIIKSNKINNKINKPSNKINNSFKNKLLFIYNVKQIKYGNNYTK